jgi:LacI family transcriptional regulator
MTDPGEGPQKATMKEIAKRAGVAISSVSRVLSGHPAVSESLRQRVLSAVAEMDYEPDHTAMSLRRGSTKTVAFLVRDIASPLFSDMVKAAEERLRGLGYSMLLTNAGDDPDREAVHIRLLARRRVDGLILSLSSESHRETTAALRAVRAPLVLVDRQLSGIPASAVLSDHYSGLRDATAHLLERGHRRIALISGPNEVLASRERLRGYKAALRSAGVRADQSLIRLGKYSEAFGQSQCLQLLALPEPPTALIAGGIQLTQGAMLALRRLNLELGRDIAFVACDPVPWGALLRPSLTIVDRSAAEIGSVAADLLLAMIAGGEPEVRVLPTRLIVGESTGQEPPAAAPARTRAARSGRPAASRVAAPR